MLQTSRKGLFGWIFYDFANSAFTTIVLTFVFSVYFADAIATSSEEGQQLFSRGIAISGILIAILAPVLGAIADHTGRRKPWILFFTALCVLGSFALWWAEPTAGMDDASRSAVIWWVLAVIVIANVGFEMAIVFYNAMLPSLIADEKMGRLSGYAWATGYIGGLLALAGCLVLFVFPAENNMFGLDATQLEHIRATSPFIGAWLAVFSIPLFLWTPDQPRTSVGYGEAISRGLGSLWNTLTEIRQRANLFRFLLAHMIYRDGLNTLFTAGGIFVAAVYGMEQTEILLFAILLNVTSAIGAAGFGILDDRIGSKNVLIISLICLSLVSVPLIMMSDKTALYILASILGLFVGSIQSSSRTMVGRMAPPGLVTETYGLFALSGKATSFLAPLMIGELTAVYGHRWGMSVLIAFLIIGLLLLFSVKEVRED